MATVFDLGLVQAFDVVYVVLLVFALVFAFLKKTKILGDSNLISAVTAAVFALMILLSEQAIDVLTFIVPWFTIFGIFLILLLLMFQIFGARDNDIFAYVKSDRGVGWTLIGVAIIIIGIGLGNVFGQQFTEQAFEDGGVAENVTVIEGTTTVSSSGVATKSFDQNVNATLFHPKTLGFITLFVILIFATGMLTGNMPKP